MYMYNIIYAAMAAAARLGAELHALPAARALPAGRRTGACPSRRAMAARAARLAAARAAVMVAARMVAARAAAARLRAELHALIAARARELRPSRERRALKPVALVEVGKSWRWRRRRVVAEDDGGDGDRAESDAAQYAQPKQRTGEAGQLGSRATSTRATG